MLDSLAKLDRVQVATGVLLWEWSRDTGARVTVPGERILEGQALPEVHAEVRQLVQKQIDLLVAQHPDDFPQQVRNVLHAALISGDARATRVATLLSIHPRTLHRRLQAFGLGYQQLVDECRFGIAKRLLTTSDRGVSEIAQMLHYADARTFIRAFRRWSGETPARWRATQTPSRRVMAS